LTDLLAPLRERYAHWLQLDPQQVLTDREEAAADVRAMQLVLRMERADPPSWHRALAAAATGAAAICVDPRTEPDGPWHDAIRDYCRGHIRKVTRRARGAHWVAAQELPGITVDLAGTQVRALVPGLVSELDPRISRLQVGGTDVPPDDPPATDTPTIASRDEVTMEPSRANSVTCFLRLPVSVTFSTTIITWRMSRQTKRSAPVATMKGFRCNPLWAMTTTAISTGMYGMNSRPKLTGLARRTGAWECRGAMVASATSSGAIIQPVIIG